MTILKVVVREDCEQDNNLPYGGLGANWAILAIFQKKLAI